VQAHGALLAQLVLRALPELTWAPVCIVRNGRVAIGDDIAAALGAEMVAVIIGERPGLSAADSLGIYLTFGPEPSVTKDAGRNCISNVRPGGLAPEEAAHRLAWLMRQATRLRLTGVGLKEDAPEQLTTAWREGTDSR
jgi:ethanolamine ammonia-lyase small subunit